MTSDGGIPSRRIAVLARHDSGDYKIELRNVYGLDAGARVGFFVGGASDGEGDCRVAWAFLMKLLKFKWIESHRSAEKTSEQATESERGASGGLKAILSTLGRGLSISGCKAKSPALPTPLYLVAK